MPFPADLTGNIDFDLLDSLHNRGESGHSLFTGAEEQFMYSLTPFEFYLFLIFHSARFARAVSRLNEMQTQEYLRLQHIP